VVSYGQVELGLFVVVEKTDEYPVDWDESNCCGGECKLHVAFVLSILHFADVNIVSFHPMFQVQLFLPRMAGQSLTVCGFVLMSSEGV
jgi:hypothetical protein